MRLLILTHRLDDPSFRVRWGRFLPAFAAAGIEAEAREYPDLGPAAEADVVVLHRRLLTGLAFARLRRRARRLVYDFDDALFHRPRAPFRSAMRERKFFRTVAGADAVLAGNRRLAGVARLRARQVLVLPSTVDVENYAPAARKRDAFTAVWIGQRATLPHLEAVRDAVLGAGIALRVIADAAPPGTEHVRWSAATEAAALAECHAGIMPLPDDPFTRGKCGYKLLQYYAARLPVVASPVGVNRALAAGGAILARGAGEWVLALEGLRDDPALRERLGAKGRGFAERRYASGPLAERLVRLLQGVASQR